MRCRHAVVFLSAVTFVFCASARAQTQAASCPVDLFKPPAPHATPAEVNAFEQRLLTGVQTLCYRGQTGWAGDLAIRATGPFVQLNLGTHYASVRIWYSPQVVAWLKQGRKDDLPDGSIIIKEQYATPPPQGSQSFSSSVPPACFQYMDEATVSSQKFLSDWSIMIRNKQASKDGWYWIEVYNGMVFDGQSRYANQYPSGGYGSYCARCHASAEKDLTFSALENIENKTYHNTGPNPADLITGPNYLTFYSDQSWRGNPYCTPQSPSTELPKAPHLLLSHPGAQAPEKQPPPPAFERQLPIEEEIRRTPSDHEKHEFRRELRFLTGEATPSAPPALACPLPNGQCMVPEAYDRVISPPLPGGNVPPGHPGWFVSSDQCQGCHSSSGTWMALPLPNGSWPNYNVNVSPYAEWRWSPMGLAGRDPIFYSQVESELTHYIAKNPNVPDKTASADYTKNTCFHCHGVMGQRTFAQDYASDPTATFDPAVVNLYPDPAKPASLYGSLARDGISCSVCHRIKDDYASLENFLNKQTTGNFNLVGAEIQGPFADNHIIVDPMKDGVGFTPKHNDYTTSSRLCGSCHVINLPVIDAHPVCPAQQPCSKFSLEQNTYAEWLNSKYQNEIGPPNSNARTCQDCHMRDSYTNAANGLNVSPLETKMAVIEDEQYPAATERLPINKITVTYRSQGFRRHDLLGLNAFLLQMFNLNMEQDQQTGSYYNTVLGLRQTDYMSGQTNDLPNAIGNIVQQAQSNTATVNVQLVNASGSNLSADVTVTNLTGHRFPSGVGFRRAFLEFDVTDPNGNLVWSSGRTDRCGEIIDLKGRVLNTEYFVSDSQPVAVGPCGNAIGKRPLNSAGVQPYHRHYSVSNPITTEDQVQVYEELVTDLDHKITTSFLLRDDDLKDNRILPAGWKHDAPIPQPYLHATYPIGVDNDPSYGNGSGTSVVRYHVQLPPGFDATKVSVTATLYYQSIPPYFLRDRLELAAGQPATERLKYLVDNTQLDDTDLNDWKLEIDQNCAGPACASMQASNARAASRRRNLALESTDRRNIPK